MLVSTFTHLMTPCESYILEWEKQPLLHCYSISISLHQYIYWICSSTNLANGKAAYSSTSTNDSHRPLEAVDGESNSYFQSSTSANQWWRVDLGRSYYVGVIRVYSSQYEKFQQVSIFLSNTETVPNSPLNLPNNNDWTESPSQFSLTADGDDFVTYITSSQDGSLPEARHIAVYSTNSSGLVINELEVYGYVIIYIPNPRTADKANDGLINSDDFYRSENDVGDQWWKVDLDTQYFIYNPIDEGDPLSVYRYVALYSTYKSGLAITEVLVFGIEKSELLVRNLKAELKEPDCVEVNWETPLTDTYTFQYQVRYDSRPWKDTNTSLSDEECGFSAYKEVEVEVKVVGSDKTESTSLTTNCADPSKPREDNLQHVEVFNLGRKMWKYTISWKAPSNINCESITEYKIRYPNVTSEEIVTADTSYEVYVEGGVEFTLSVRAVNNMGLHSDYLDITETSPDIAPQWGSATVTMETLNSSCVELTWSRPEYPGGDITSYQLTCTNMAAMDKLPSTSTSQTVCRYSAYTLVECNISAENTAGFGEYIEFDSVYTSCEDVERVCPPPPPVRNAETLSTQSDWKTDSVVTYLCLEGYYRTGNAQLTCVVEEGKSVWLGEIPECELLNTSNDCSEYRTALLAGGIACGLVILILITIIITLVRQLHIRKFTDSTQQSKSTDEYEEVGPNHLHPVMSHNNSVELPVSGVPHPSDVGTGSVYESIDKRNTVADGIKDYTGLEDVSFSSNYEHLEARQSGNNYERMNYDDKPKPQANKVYENCDKD
ncbi:hypothetical protein EB796_012790 [Bugula neritina]|uniref:Uncharacterized protein n=1 Tax=Bugula neritina TaxID=10212 RepID=A0A7J7JSM9_BUGNE|nr:hypothetical protein EB796_012790 [Bugula neritina]